MNESLKELAQIVNELSDKKAVFYRHILLISTTLFGILISLHSKGSYILYVRLFFALAIVSLALGILSVAIVLYGQIEDYRSLKDNYVKEALSAEREFRQMGPVLPDDRKIFLFFEKAAYKCFGVCLLLLSCYSVLLAFAG